MRDRRNPQRSLTSRLLAAETVGTFLLALWLHSERPQQVVTRAETQVPLPRPTRAPA